MSVPKAISIHAWGYSLHHTIKLSNLPKLIRTYMPLELEHGAQHPVCVCIYIYIKLIIWLFQWVSHCCVIEWKSLFLLWKLSCNLFCFDFSPTSFSSLWFGSSGSEWSQSTLLKLQGFSHGGTRAWLSPCCTASLYTYVHMIYFTKTLNIIFYSNL